MCLLCEVLPIPQTFQSRVLAWSTDYWPWIVCYANNACIVWVACCGKLCKILVVVLLQLGVKRRMVGESVAHELALLLDWTEWMTLQPSNEFVLRSIRTNSFFECHSSSPLYIKHSIKKAAFCVSLFIKKGLVIEMDIQTVCLSPISYNSIRYSTSFYGKSFISLFSNQFTTQHRTV